MRMRSALMVAVYQKQLKLSSSARTRHSAGEIVNYIAVDAYRMGEFPWWFHIAWTSALRLFFPLVFSLLLLVLVLFLVLCLFLYVDFSMYHLQGSCKIVSLSL